MLGRLEKQTDLNSLLSQESGATWSRPPNDFKGECEVGSISVFELRVSDVDRRLVILQQSQTGAINQQPRLPCHP